MRNVAISAQADKSGMKELIQIQYRQEIQGAGLKNKISNDRQKNLLAPNLQYGCAIPPPVDLQVHACTPPVSLVMLLSQGTDTHT